MLLNKECFTVTGLKRDKTNLQAYKNQVLIDTKNKHLTFTNGHALNRVTMPTDFNVEDFPTCNGFEINPVVSDKVLIDSKLFDKSGKNIPKNKDLRIVEHVLLSESDDKLSLIKNDLESISVTPILKDDTNNYPDVETAYETARDDNKQAEIKLSIAELEVILKSVKSFNASNKDNDIVKFSIHNDSVLVKIDTDNWETGQNFSSILMAKKA